MTLQDLKAGKEFSFKDTHYLSLFQTEDGGYCVTRHNQYYANITKMNEKVIKIYTYLLNTKVEAEIIISECVDIEVYRKELDERIKIRKAMEQEMIDEYGIGAYEW